MISLLGLFVMQALAATDQWLCTQEASQMRENSILSCGVGTGVDENEARSGALSNARAEFNALCKASDTCNGRQVSVEPKRTSCERLKGSYKCYRLIVFTLGDKKKGKRETASQDETEALDTPEEFEPFVYEAVAHLPKVAVGMPKKSVLKAFGAPHSVMSVGKPTNLMLMYKGHMCVYQRCAVFVDNGTVQSWQDFKPIYTEDLK